MERIQLIWRSGNAFVVTIPKKRLRKENLKPGDFVAIKFKKVIVEEVEDVE